MRRRGFTLMELITVLGIVCVLSAILYPVFSQARQSATKATCQQNLYQLGMALQLYARDNDGRLPARFNDFSPLAGRYLADLSVLQCPEDPADAAATAERGHNASLPLTFGYQYRGGLTLEDRADIPVAADWDYWHLGGGNILFLSGSVRYYRAGNIWIPVSRGPRPFPAGLKPRTISRMRFLNDLTPQPYVPILPQEDQ